MRGNDGVGSSRGYCRDRHETRLCAHVVATEKIEPVECVTGNQPFDFVEHGEWIERAELRFKVVGCEPDGVTICLAGMRATRLAQVGGHAAFAEGNQHLDIDSHAACETHEDFEVGLDTGAIGCFLHQLHIAKGVGDSAGFFVKTRGWKDNVGQRGGLREEDVLHNDEGVLQCRGTDAETRHWIGANHQQRAEFRVRRLPPDRLAAPIPL